MTGMLSLAYMAELSVVFNLAYAELKSGRYIAKTVRVFWNSSTPIDDQLREDMMEGLNSTLELEAPLDSFGQKLAKRVDTRIAEMAKAFPNDVAAISHQYGRMRDLFDSDRTTRAAAWNCEWSRYGFKIKRWYAKKHNFWLSPRFSYWLFNSRWDRMIAYFGVASSTIVVILATLMDNAAHQPAKTAKQWSGMVPLVQGWTDEQVFTTSFCVLITSIILPGLMILLGNLMARHLRLSLRDIHAALDAIYQRSFLEQIGAAIPHDTNHPPTMRH